MQDPGEILEVAREEHLECDVLANNLHAVQLIQQEGIVNPCSEQEDLLVELGVPGQIQMHHLGGR